MSIKEFKNDLVAFLLPLLFVVLIYNSAFLSPTDYMFGVNGDGVKNYFTLAWFVENNTDWIHHSAMKYPFGEHYLYTDGFVPFGWLFKALGLSGVQAIGFVNFLMLFSIVLTSFFAYKILRHFDVRTYLSIIAGFAIAILSPQLTRITGHYALGLSFFFLLSFWLFLKYLVKMNSWWRTILIFLNGIFWLMIHPYLGIIVTLFMFLSWFFILLKNRKYLQKKWRTISQAIVQALLPLVSFKLFLVLTDTHLSRPDKPWGFWLFQGSWKSTLIPSFGPFSKTLKTFFEFEKVPWETYSYIGLTTIVLLGVYFLRILFLKENLNLKKSNSKDWNTFTIPAFLLLFLSVGLPFYWIPELVDLFSPIRNFRVMGRFAWAFYYIITLFTVYKLNSWIDQTNFKNSFKTILLTLIIGVMIWEGVGSHLKISKKIKNPNYFAIENLSQEMQSIVEEAKKINAESILPLPFYHLGTYRSQPNNEDLFKSMIVSYHTNIPLLSNDLPRTSVIENKQSLSIIFPDGYTKYTADVLPKESQVLLLETSNVSHEVEKKYLKNSTPLIGFDKIKLSKINSNQLTTRTGNKTIDFENLVATDQANFFAKKETDINFVYQEFDREVVQTFKKRYNILKELRMTSEVKNYELSIWYENHKNERIPVNILIESTNSEGKLKRENSFALNDHNLFSGDSIRCVMRFEVKKNLSYKILYTNPVHDAPEITCLNWMLKSIDNTIYNFNGDSVSIDNHKKLPYQLLNNR